MHTHPATRLPALILSLRFVARIQTSLNSCDWSWQQNSVSATMIFTCHTRRFVAGPCSNLSQRRVAAIICRIVCPRPSDRGLGKRLHVIDGYIKYYFFMWKPCAGLVQCWMHRWWKSCQFWDFSSEVKCYLKLFNGSKMTVFSKTASFNDLVPLLPALDLPATLKMLFSHRNFVHALAGAVVSRYLSITWHDCHKSLLYV